MSFQTSHLFNVNGLVAVITGGGTGLGLIMAKALALNGAAKVYIVGRRKEVLESAAKESPYGNILPLVGDVTSKDSLEAVAKQITDEVGYINVLIANSGVMGPNPAALQIKDLGQFQEALWKQDFDAYTNTSAVNTTAAYFTVVAFLGLLEKGNQTGHLTQRSQIIITSSISGFAREPTTGYAYGDSKAATTHLTKQLASTLAPFGIRVNALAPGRKTYLPPPPKPTYST